MGEMKKFVPRGKDNPEARIQKAIIDKLTLMGWYVKETHGNLYQFGFPDLFCTHSKYRQRWVEVKNPVNYRFTNAQLEVFPKLCANGSPVWILVSDSDSEINKLFGEYNWYKYLK